MSVGVFNTNIPKTTPASFCQPISEMMIWKICKLEFVRMVRVELRDFWGILRKDRDFSKIIISAHRLAHTHSCQASMCWCECRALIFRFKVAPRAKIKPNNGNTNFHDYMLLNVQMFTCVCLMRLKWWGEKCKFSFTKWQFAEAMRYMRMHTRYFGRAHGAFVAGPFVFAATPLASTIWMNISISLTLGRV